MREIRFRAWDKLCCKWVTDRYGISLEDGLIVYDRKAGDEDQLVFRSPKSSCYQPGCFDGVVLMQYTGLKDKNGVEVYEGDILEIDCYMFVVEWNENSASFQLYNKGWQELMDAVEIPKYELRGNIHTNPELLKSNG